MPETPGSIAGRRRELKAARRVMKSHARQLSRAIDCVQRLETIIAQYERDHPAKKRAKR